MQDLEITWPDGVGRFSPADSPVHVGRSSSAAVPLTEGSVSRRHLEFAWGGTYWTASDNSTHGTFDTGGVRLAPRWTISDETVIRLGGIKGVAIEIRPVPNAAAEQVVGLNEDSLAGNGDRTSVMEADPGRAAIGAPALDQAPDPAKASGPGPAVSPTPQRSGGLFSDDHNSMDVQKQPAAESEVGSLFAERPPAETPSDAPPPPNADAQNTPAKGSSILSDAPPPPSARQGGFTNPQSPQADALRPPLEPSPSPVGPQPKAETRSAFDPQNRDEQRRNDDADRVGVAGPTGGHPAIRLGPNSTVISDSAIRLSVDGQDYSFLPGAEVTVGRDPNCLIHVDEKHSLVSRRHLQVTFDDGHWWIEDFSSKGTFVDGKRLTAPYQAEGAFLAHLGDDDAGTPMRVITSGEHRAPRQLNLLAVAALAAVALIPLILLASLLTRNDGPSNDPDFESAKRSTVMLFGLEGGQGTGFFVDDNLIVTNQHVAVLSPQMLVGVSRETDEPAQIEYATELVANHPYLDIAVLRISNKATMTSGGPLISADPVGSVGLPSVTLGDSNDIAIGDEVFSTGFPDRLSITSTDDAGELRLPPVAATSGEAASFTIWPGCSNPDFESFIPAESPQGVGCSADGDVNRGVLRSTFSSGQGASGSAVFRNNEVVAVVYAGDADDPNTSLNIATDAFDEWLQDILNQNG